ncbi:MAG: hypothetical protein EPO40_03075 [Myxococcaceae bacterium]|nr:MAG: hypothetical protein EPO40_03075 [Myxococcaceae bacterium]
MTTLIPRLYAVDKTTGALSPIDGWSKIELSPVRNEAGAITVEMAAGAPGYSTLAAGIDAALNKDVEVEIHVSGSATGRFRGFLQQKAGDDLGRGKKWTFSGSFLEQLLSEALVYPGTGAGYNDKKELTFSAVSPGTVLITAAQQAQTRGALSGVTWDFTTSVDSAGVAWATSLTNLSFTPGTSIQAIASKLEDLQVAEFELSAGRVLRAWNYGTRGTDRTTGGTPLRFAQAANLGTASHRESARTPDSGTAVLVKGAEGYYGQASDATALANRGRRVEVASDAGNIATQSGVDAAAQATMAIKKIGVAAYEYAVALGGSNPAPRLDFEVGDWAFCVVGQQFVRRRISQYVITFEQGKAPTAVVALNDLVTDPLVALYQKLAALADGGAVVGTSTATPGGDADTLAPAAPTGLTASSIAYQDDAAGETYASVTFGWSAVTTNTDGSAIGDLAGYKVQYAYLGLGQVGPPLTGSPAPTLYYYEPTPSNGITATSFTFGGVGAGSDVGLRVAAFDSNGNQGPWSSRLDFTTAIDNTPPPVPATPTLNIWFRTVDITSNGRGSAGEVMPLDIDGFEVWVSRSATITVPSTLTNPVAFDPAATGAQHVANLGIAGGTWNVSDLPVGIGYYAALRSYDRAGNPSALSAVAGPVQAETLVQIDIGPNAIGRSQIIDLEVIRAKIDNLAVNSAKVEEIQAGLVTTGTLVATVTLSGIIRTASSGLRWEGDPAGIRFYNSAGTKTIDLQGASGSALITGQLQSALSGKRWVMTVAGDLLLYPTAGSAYSRLWNLGTGIAMRGPLDSSGYSGRVNVDSSGVGINFSAETDLGNLLAEVLVQDRKVQISATNHYTYLDGRYTPVDSSGERFYDLMETNSSGTPIASTRLRYSNYSGQPTWMSPGSSCGFRFDPGAGGVVQVVNNASTTYTQLKGILTNTSSQESKTDIEEVRTLFDPIAMIQSAPSKAWRYITDVNVYGEAAPIRFGPMAEALPAVLVRETPNVDSTALEKSVDVGSMIGVLWAVVNQLLTRRITSTTATCVVPSGTTIGPGATIEVPCTWESSPLAPPEDALVFLNAGLLGAGRVTAWLKPGSVTDTGATVVFRNISNSPVRSAAAGALAGLTNVTATVIGQALYSPPLAA